jgi:hypothetical protein
MTATVAQLVEKALLLTTEARSELVEALLERSEPSQALLSEQILEVERRMARVRGGESGLIDEETAHVSVLNSLRSAK